MTTDQLPESVADEIRFTEWLETLRAQVIETVNGVAVRGARAIPFTLTGAGQSSRLVLSPCSLMGIALRGEGSVELLDGFDNTGPLVMPLRVLAAYPDNQLWLGPGGVNCSTGLVVSCSAYTAQIDGVAWVS